MAKKNPIMLAGVTLTLAACGAALAQNKPVANVDSGRHQFIAAAQRYIVQAWGSIDEAQRAQKDQLGGHAEKAKTLLDQANAELKAAAEYADQHHR